MKICVLILWIEFGTRPKTQVSPDCDLSHKSRSRVPCTEGGPGQSRANVPTNHENAWALDLCFGILPRGTAKKLLKSLVAPVGPQTTRAESKGNESALDSLFSLDTTNRQNARRGLWPQYPHGGLLGFVGTQAGGPPARLFGNLHDSNLVDPASSHTLVSKIKPCMSKYKHFIL